MICQTQLNITHSNRVNYHHHSNNSIIHSQRFTCQSQIFAIQLYFFSKNDPAYFDLELRLNSADDLDLRLRLLHQNQVRDGQPRKVIGGHRGLKNRRHLKL